MNRLTKDDVKEMGLVDLAHNQVFIKDGEAWYRDFGREISIRDLAKEMFNFHNIKYSQNLDEFDEDMMYLLDDGYETIEGIIALFYRALWSMADIREKLKAYEDTGLDPEEMLKAYNLCVENLGNFEKLLDENIKLKKYEYLEEQGLLIKLPCKIGDYVYEANINRNIVSTYKIMSIVIGKDSINYNWGLLDGIYSNIKGFNEFALGKTVFLTREEAEKALSEDKQ